MRVIVEAEMILDEPTADQGLVTWFQARVLKELEGEEGPVIVRARFARVHVGMAMDVGERLHDVLDADSAELQALYGEFFDEDWFQEQFEEGAGSDLLYLSEITVDSEWVGRNVELALVRRLCDTLGQGCELAVIEYVANEDLAGWQRLGFAGEVEEGAGGFLHLPLGSRQTRVLPSEDADRFRVVANPLPGSDSH